MFLSKSPRPGISVLLACQDEEHLVGASMVSFLRMADEVLVVDNGSTDRSVEVICELSEAFPSLLRVYSRPDLEHLYENRQYALERATRRWIIRGDSDYVCYTEGPLDCLWIRRYLAKRGRLPLPVGIRAPHASIFGDWSHTVSERRPSGYSSVISKGDTRIYRRFPGMRFQRIGRWEGVVLPKRISRTTFLNKPLWLHCDIKSETSYFRRSERTNWRELGNFDKYPKLDDYIQASILPATGARTIKEAAKAYVGNSVLPYMKQYDPDKYLPLPSLVERMAKDSYGYKVISNNGGFYRIYNGPPPVGILVDFGRRIVGMR